MGVSYGKLFQIHVEHMYFANMHFPGCTIFPVEESQSLILKCGLMIKPQPDGFILLFGHSFAGIERDRISVLKEMIILQFHFQLTDPSFYRYTGNLPDDLVHKIFWFSNFDEKQKDYRKSNLLHLSEFVAESEIKQAPEASHFFGTIEIQFDENLKEDFYVRFLNKSVHWRYIIVSEHLQQFEKLAILVKGNKKLFSGPEIVGLPNGSKGFAFTSIEPIALTQQNKTSLQLVINYDEITGNFEKKLIFQLPAPSLFTDADLYESIVYL